MNRGSTIALVPASRARGVAARLAVARAREQTRALAPGAAPPRIVALGGGTGLPVLLRGLRHAMRVGDAHAGARPDIGYLTAVVTVADDGGSTGRLREAYGMLAPGDIRNCLLALADATSPLATLFDYRFEGREVRGHSLGNLMLAALSRMESRFDRAVDRAGDLLEVQGRVLPATAASVRLVAEFEDGTRIEGESRIAAARRRIRRVRLHPEPVPALPRALEAIAAADCVVIGPGSLYTSLIPVLLAEGMTEAIAASGARVLLVMNLMTEPGETDDLRASDHVRALRAHAPGLVVHDVILNGAPVPEPRRRRYAAQAACPVSLDVSAVATLAERVWTADLLAAGPEVRHDPHRLAEAVLEVAGRGRVRVYCER